MITPDWPLYARRGVEMARLMRWVICAVVVLAFAPGALADDLNLLRGSQSVGPATFPNWSGFYFGAQADYSSESADFTKASQPLLASSLRNLTLEEDDHISLDQVLGKSSTRTQGYGGFVGYNTQWQDLVLGVEANYIHGPATIVGTSTPLLDRVVTAGTNTYSVNVAATGTMDITDYGSLRARAGWLIGNNFMPYGFAGLALGYGGYSVSTLVYGQQDPQTPPVVPCNLVADPTCVDYAFNNSAGRNNVFLYGFSVGGGVDVALASNVFLRAEYEYMQFAEIANITAAISSVRVGVGFKF
jgi:outer membrane immunogenic protein